MSNTFVLVVFTAIWLSVHHWDALPASTYEKCRLSPPEYSQVAPIYLKGPSTTSTPMVGDVNPDCRGEKEPLKETEQKDW